MYTYHKFFARPMSYVDLNLRAFYLTCGFNRGVVKDSTVERSCIKWRKKLRRNLKSVRHLWLMRYVKVFIVYSSSCPTNYYYYFMVLNFGCHLPWAEIWNTAFSFIICDDDDAASSLMEFYVPAHLTNSPEFHSYNGIFKPLKIFEKRNFFQKLLSSRLKIFCYSTWNSWQHWFKSTFF